MADDGVYSAADREAARRAQLLRRQREDARRRDARSRERTFVDSIIETVTVAFADSSGRTPQVGRPMTYEEAMRRSAPQRSAAEFDSLSDEADDSDSGDERAAPRRVSPPPSPKTYDEALRPPAVARVVDDHEDASTFASTLSDDASETTEEDPYHVASPSPRRKASALPENGVLPPALLPSVLRDDGEAAPRAPAAPLM
mmetsp:Transcript_19290/g.50197  ORF Transcript_19290/g.50197 Transcript_19290/m.50197 type:complete len:200 (-) Transcript_19290:17-616(-)